MTSSARRYLAGSWRTLCSAFTLDPTAEKFAFARFNENGDNDVNEFAVPETDAGPPRRRTVQKQQFDTELSEFPSKLSEATAAPGGGDGGDAVPADKAQDGGHGLGEEFCVGEMSSKDKRNRISTWQAGWNVTNAIQGMFIVSFPYTVLQGGCWALVSMVVIAYICCYTGKILVDCLYEDDVNVEPVVVSAGVGGVVSPAAASTPTRPAVTQGCIASFRPGQRRVRDSYVAIAEEVWGRQLGGRLVFGAQLIELLMTCILYVLLCGDLLLGIFPNAPLNLTAWIVVSTAPLLLCAFLRSLRHVAWLSFWCTAAHMVVNGIVLVYCFTRVREWRWDAVQVRIDIRTFPLAFGIIVFSYTSQIFLPSLEANLIDRSQFATMMHWTHIAAAIFKVAFAYIGFVTFGDLTDEVITNNLPNRTLKVIVNAFLVAKALLSYPLPYFAAAELIETAFFRGRPETVFPSCYESGSGGGGGLGCLPGMGGGALKTWALGLRLGLVIATMLMAIFVPHFAILMGLIGSFTGNMLSLVWPAYFHLRIKSGSIGWVRRSADVAIVMFGLLYSGLGIYYSSQALFRAFHGQSLRPFQQTA